MKYYKPSLTAAEMSLLYSCLHVAKVDAERGADLDTLNTNWFKQRVRAINRLHNKFVKAGKCPEIKAPCE